MEKTVRFFIRSALILSLITGGFFAGHGDWGRTLLFMILVPLFLYLPSWFYERNHKRFFNITFLMEMELLIFVGMSLAVLGENFLYFHLPGFDSMVHFTNGALLTIFVVSLNHARWLDERLSPIKTVLLAGFLPAFVNELYEWGADSLLDTRLWGDVFKSLWIDTVSDIILQILGSIVAVFILINYFHRWLERWHNKKTEL